MESTEPQKRPLEPTSPGAEGSSKRSRPDTEEAAETSYPHARPPNETIPIPVSTTGLVPKVAELPPSLELVTGMKSDIAERKGFISQSDVGIIGYVGQGLTGVRGVIKQRFTDFMVYEVVPSGEVLHLKDIGMPKEPESEKPTEVKEEKLESEETAANGDAAPTEEAAANGTIPESQEEQPIEEDGDASQANGDSEPLPSSLEFEPHPSWSTSTTHALRPHFSDETIISLHALLVEGKDAPAKSDGGWGSRPSSNPEEAALNTSSSAGPSRGQGRDRGRGRGRGGGRGGRADQSGKWWTSYPDTREVVSQPMPDKDSRGAAHKAIRELFRGMFESGTKQAGDDVRLTIKYGRGGQRREQRDRPQKPKQNLPPYIHFTLHKTNRDTQDALAHIARLLNCYPKELSVCGTKDKRAVTVQRVCLKRGGRTLQSVWKAANNLKRKSMQAATTERGERGTRIGDLLYSSEALDLGMLNGNYFVITLRNIQAEPEDIDKVMTSLRNHGFINFYGMQRFGTSTVPTHTTGLSILQGKWGEALDSILSLREGEHPDCVRGRLAWLDDGDVNKALALMPRRCIAERSIWDFWKRGNPKEDKLGALGSIPRNLRTMYVHAYQSYIWNLVVSERIKMGATEAMVGDLVFVGEVEDTVLDTSSTREVKQLGDEDVGEYKIFDVVMPLPGHNVEYPGGRIGELYEKILRADGLDPHHMRRDQRDYSLPGGYRRIINLPQHVGWTHIRYTDPDIGLAQSDEDALLEMNKPAEDDPEGKFRAVKVELQLGAAAYATMALREITREETSSWHQINLTLSGEDQEHKGTGRADVADEGEEAEAE